MALWLWDVPTHAKNPNLPSAIKSPNGYESVNQANLGLAGLLGEMSGVSQSVGSGHESIVLPKIHSWPSAGATFVYKTSIKDSHSPSIVVGKFYTDERRSFLSQESISLLQKTYQFLETQRGWSLRIEAQCDDRGPAAYNFILGGKHARNLKWFFHDLGVPLSKIETFNYGGVPLCSDSLEACQQDKVRTYDAFRLLSISQPRNGCLMRLRVMVDPHRREQSWKISRAQFLQRLRIAEVSLP